MLLPPSEDETDEPDEDPRADLVQQLVEYQRYREAALALGERAILSRDVFRREPAAAANDRGEGIQLRDVTIGHDTQIEAFCHLDGAEVGDHARIGPYARLRPGATLEADVHVGNFVEIKASTLGRGAKANHLAYIGDSEVGAGANYGAGSITANYDGANKHKTVIGDHVHVGSNCVLIAPLTIGAGATIGGGSTIVDDVPAGTLCVARSRQVTIPGWKRPRKEPKG